MTNELTGIPQFHESDTLTHPQGKSLKSLAREFESLFIQQMLAVMREGMGEDGLFEGNTGQDTYSAMMDQALAQALASKGGLGIAEPLYRQLKAMEEASQRRAAGVDLPAAEVPALGTQGNLDEPSVSPSSGLLGELAENRISSGLGWRRDPFDGEWRFHRGVDFALEAGAPVRSVNAGKVVFSGEQGGFGNTVVVESADGTKIRYAHLKELSVRTGEEVEEGASLGAVGSTGRSTGPHLHVEVENHGRLVNPLI